MKYLRHETFAEEHYYNKEPCFGCLKHRKPLTTLITSVALPLYVIGRMIVL
jgi:hypothetical protein